MRHDLTAVHCLALRVQATTQFVLPRTLAMEWDREQEKLLELTQVDDENYGPHDGKPKFECLGRPQDSGVLIDMRPVLDTPGTSAEMTRLLRTVVAQKRLLKRTYKPGLPSNPVVDGVPTNEFCLQSLPFSRELKAMPVVARVIDFGERTTGLRVRGVSVNVYSKGRVQGSHWDYTDATTRMVVPLATENSSRDFEITDVEGDVLFSHQIVHGDWVAILMEGDDRGPIFKRKHCGCINVKGNHASMIITFETDIGSADKAALARDCPTRRPGLHPLGPDFAEELAEIVRDGVNKPPHPFTSERVRQAVPPLSYTHILPLLESPPAPCTVPPTGAPYSGVHGGSGERGAIRRCACRPSARRSGSRTARRSSRGRRGGRSIRGVAACRLI